MSDVKTNLSWRERRGLARLIVKGRRIEDPELQKHLPRAFREIEEDLHKQKRSISSSLLRLAVLAYFVHQAIYDPSTFNTVSAVLIGTLLVLEALKVDVFYNFYRLNRSKRVHDDILEAAKADEASEVYEPSIKAGAGN